MLNDTDRNRKYETAITNVRATGRAPRGVRTSWIGAAVECHALSKLYCCIQIVAGPIF